MNGDVVTDLNVTRLLDFHRSQGGEATIALHPVEDPSHFGVVPTDDGGRVLAFVEKPPRSEAPTNLINAGTYVFEPRALERIASSGPVSVERETFPAMAAANALYAMADDAYWLDTGTPHLYLQANVDILKGLNNQHQFEGIVDGSWRAASATDRRLGETRQFGRRLGLRGGGRRRARGLGVAARSDRTERL